MTGIDKTDTTKPLFGISVPYAVTVQGVAGATGFSVSSQGPGAVTADGPTATSLALEVADGDTVDGSVLGVQMRTIGAGGAASGAGLAYRTTNDGSAFGGWFGCDAPWVATGYQLIVDSAATYTHYDLCAMDAGRAMLAYSTGSTIGVRVREPDGGWGSEVTAGALVSPGPCALWRGLDRAYYVMAAKPKPGLIAGTYTMRISRSDDDGATWTVQTYDAGLTVDHTNDRRTRVAALRGSVVAFVTNDTGTASTVKQYASTDGINFSLVSASAVKCVVWDVRADAGTLHVLTVEEVGGTATLRYRSIGVASASLWDGEAIDIDPWDYDNPVSIAVRPDDGLLVAVAQNLSLRATQYWASSDAGATWTGGTLHPFGSSIPLQTEATAAFVRGSMLTVSGDGDSTCLVERRYGGHSQATVSSAFDTSGPWDRLWEPAGALSTGGWTSSTTGSPTRTLAKDTGQKVVNGAGDVQNWTYTYGASSEPAIFRAVVRVTSAAGNLTLRCYASTARIEVKVTDTTIALFDAFGGGGFQTVTHGIDGYIDIIAIVDPANARAFVCFGEYSVGTSRSYTDMTAATGLHVYATTDIVHELTASASVTAYVLWAGVGRAVGTELGNGWSRPAELDPLPLSSRASYLAGGLSVMLAKGLPVIDGVTYSAALTSPYRLEAALPRVLPTPRTGWRSDGLRTETLTFTLDEPDAPGLVVLDLHGLVGVSKFTLNGASVDLEQTLLYDGAGHRSILPARSGTTTTGPWVRADELRGWHFRDSANTVHVVTGNTEGSLTYGSTIGEHRAVIYLDGDVDTVTRGTGYLYPARAVVYGHYSAATVLTQAVIAIADADQYGGATIPEGYRAIGLLNFARVHVVGVGADLDDTIAIDDEANLQTLPNGQRYSARRSLDGQRYQYQWMQSPRQEVQQRGESTSPDYVTNYTGGTPVASLEGLPLMIRGLMDRVRGDGIDRRDVPVLVCPAIARKSSTGLAVRVWGLTEVYGRITGPVRVEHLPYVGRRGDSQVARIAAITVEAER